MVRCHALCEMGLLFLVHLRVETVCVSLSDVPRQTQGSPIFVQLIGVSEQEYYSSSTEPQSVVYLQTLSRTPDPHPLEASQ